MPSLKGSSTPVVRTGCVVGKVKIVSMELVQVNTPTQFSPYILEIQLITFVFLLILLFMYFIIIFFIVFLFFLDATDQNSLCDMLVMKCKYFTWQGKKNNHVLCVVNYHVIVAYGFILGGGVLHAYFGSRLGVISFMIQPH